jgi:hypothetical protein
MDGDDLPHSLSNAGDSKPTLFGRMSSKASGYHAQIPYLSKVPGSAIAIILTLIFVNAVVWAAVGVILVGPAILKSEINISHIYVRRIY